MFTDVVDFIKANATNIVLVLVTVLTVLRASLVAQGIPETWIDQTIALLGNLTVIAVRTQLPAGAKGYTYTAAGAGAAGAAAGLIGAISPPAALAVSSIGFALSGLGFSRAVKEVRAAHDFR